MIELRCKVCDAGTLRRRQVFRKTRTAVDVGYVMLASSIPSFVICILSFVTLPSHRAGDTSNAPSAGPFLLLGLTALISGLFGWVLVMKKDVLECNVCRNISEPVMNRKKS
jgi:drug/metabolite transporter (DMT)-like permease